MTTLKKIAVIDDDQVFQMIVKKQLAVSNVDREILKFFNGDEAFKYFQKNVDNLDALPEYIMLDVNMPIKDGWDFLEDYRSLPKVIRERIKIYMVTSSVMKSDIDRALNDADVEDYVSKPVSSEKLVELFQ